MGWRVGLGVVVVVLAGCRDDGVDVPATELRDGTGWGCRSCGFSNSPVLGVHDLEQFYVGQDSVAGFRLVAMRDENDTEYDVSMNGDTLVASKSGVQFTGSQLLGWRLVFEDELGGVYEVEVYSYQVHPDWAAGDPIDTWSLVYDDGGELSNVCPGLDPDETSVVFIAGETYDLASNTVLSKQSGWVTVACRGHALAKMKLLGYDPTDDYGSTVLERQATIRMITADYCGDGHSFTALGQPIDWADLRGSFPIAGADPARLETKWDADGALCLDTPRLVQRSAVEAHCGKLPTCSGDLSFGTATWITVRP